MKLMSAVDIPAEKVKMQDWLLQGADAYQSQNEPLKVEALNSQ